MSNPNYKLIDHTADLGIHVFGGDESQLYQHAAMAMFDLIIDAGRSEACQQSVVSASAVDLPDLMVNWLRELLNLWNSKLKILRTVAVDDLTRQTISARVSLEAYNPEKHNILREIKAVTYHQIDVFAKDDHWEARIIFDV